ncbi:MAG: hypothetical protein ACJAVK_002196, partial [Akkermansiaceae bacterium]
RLQLFFPFEVMYQSIHKARLSHPPDRTKNFTLNRGQ